MEPAEPRPPRYRITVPPGTTRVLAIGVALLLAMHMSLQFVRFTSDAVPWEIQQMFDVDQEQSVPTWYSSALLAFAALLLFAIAGAKRRARDADSGRWLALGIIFTALSFDEVAGIHETVNSLSKITWVVPGAIFVVLFAVYYTPFLFRLPPRIRWQVALAGLLYVGGALAVEFDTLQFLTRNAQHSLAYNLLSGCEEGMEMFGAVLFIHALLGYMRGAADPVSIEIGAPRVL